MAQDHTLHQHTTMDSTTWAQDHTREPIPKGPGPRALDHALHIPHHGTCPNGLKTTPTAVATTPTTHHSQPHHVHNPPPLPRHPMAGCFHCTCRKIPTKSRWPGAKGPGSRASQLPSSGREPMGPGLGSRGFGYEFRDPLPSNSGTGSMFPTP